MQKTKICSKCGEELLATTENFYARKDSKDRLMSDCKECTKKRIKQYVLDNTEKAKKTHKTSNKKYRLKNKDKISEQNRQYNIKNKDKKNQYRLKNKEHITIKVKQYYIKNKDKISEYKKNWAEDNKDKIKEIFKIWKEYNDINYKSYHKIYEQKRIARKLLLPYTLTIEQWEKTKLYFSNCCCYCGEKLPLEQEHLIPVTKGGAYANSNIVCACRSCNASKSNNDFEKWYPKYTYYTKERKDFILEYLKINKDERLTSAI